MNFAFPATALALTFSLFSITGHAAPRTTVDIDGNGLIEINDLADLNEIRKNLEGKALYGSSQGCPADGCVGFELKANLDFDTNGDGKIDANDEYWNNGEGWEPIGSSSSNAFKAVFEGNGHVIRNLNINRAFYVGLFGYADNATIRRVGLTGTLTQITGQSYVGGILGYGTATHLQGVFASGILLSSSTSSTRMGGVAGYLTSNSTIEDSFSTASVTAKYTWVGGLVGNLYNSTVNRAFSTGRVSNDGATTYTGGLIGYASSSTVTQSYWAIDSSGQSSSGGTSNSNSSYFGITLAELGCASASNNTSCVSGKTLFENWPTDAAANNGIAWVFDGNGLPALSLNGKQYRDRDGDGYLDQDDQWPDNYAAAIDFDKDGHPDRWTLGCDDECITNSGLTLDMFPETAAAWQDDDLDGFPDDWAAGCDVSCQNASDLTLDPDPLDPYNGTPPDGIVIIDADHNGLIDIHTLDDLNAIRYNLEGTGLKLSANDENNSEGCPPRLVNGQMQRLCKGYELKADLDFDTNGDGEIDVKDGDYWNGGEGWLPIGSSSNAFKAVFEGNGHVIRNLYIRRPNAYGVGLFGYTNNATIRRVGLTGTLTKIKGQSYVGGVLGYGEATHLQGVFASGAVSSSYNTNNTYMGGVAGYLMYSTIEDSFSTASVTAKNDRVGGLVGHLSSSAVNRTFSTGRVYSDLGSNIGGLIGYASSNIITQSYWATDSSGQSRSNGTSNSNPSYFGITLAELGCASASNNTSCVSNKTLFENWPTGAAANDGIAWVFDGNGLPALSLNGKQYRDRDGDGYLDQDDQWPDNYAAAIDFDKDGYPDRWTLGCDDECVANSGLTLDMFPETAAAWQDDDMDGFPDSWADDCDEDCQNASDLTLDPVPLDPYNGTPPDGIVIIDADHNGLIDIHTLDDLNAIRYNLEGTGLKLSANDENNSEGCPPRLVNGQMQRLCRGYELKADLDFDTNSDGKIDEKDTYWNNGEGWLPIGNNSSGNAFRAIFEGNGHVIRNLYINRPGTSYIGLFGYANNATIRRVGLTGTLTQITGQSYVGGVLGYGTATHLQGVFASGAVSSSYNTSNTYMGGVAGYLMYSTIEDSFSTASVTANNDRVGGLVGYLSNSAVNRTFSTGRVYSDLGSNIGGLIGYASSNIITQSYWATDSSGQSSSGGTSSSNSSYFGITLAELGCASVPNNTSCVSGKILFEDWPTDATANNGIAWVFDGNGLPALSLNGKQYRDRDGDGYLDQDDQWPDNYAAAIDFDKDGHPDRWTLGCDDECVANSGLTLDMFPETAAAWQDDDLDDLPDSWAVGCDVSCQKASGLTLDEHLNDHHNGNPPAGIVIVDADHNGLIEIETLEQLNAIRYNLEGTGLVLTEGGEVNVEGCPPRLVNGQMQRLCKGYELKADLDFDTNGDGKIDESDTYWNGEEGWLPIGNSSSGNAFRAIFEGNGHAIRNLYINRPDTNYIGLFGYADNATIRRVGLTGTLTQIAGRQYVGGVLGYGTATHLQGVFVSGALSSAYTSSAYMGGVAGYLTSNSTIEDSVSTASVTAKNDRVGGLVGYLSSSAVSRVFSTGRVHSDRNSSWVGGLIGSSPSSTVTQSYWAIDSSGQSSSYGASNSNSSSYFGVTLAELGCATSPDDTNCVSGKTLFENWPTDATANNGIAWVFDGNGLPALSLNGKQHRDRDGDGYLDQDDQWPDDYAAAIDFDKDGHPDRWTLGCDDECVTNSGLTLDMFPETAAAWQDDDLDGLPDSWAVGCDVGCQNASGLTLDTHLNDHHNGNPPDGIVIVDADHNGLIEIETLEQLDAIRYNLEGTGLKLSANDENNSEGCPPRLVNGQMQRLCKGYELKKDLDFDINDDYWNDGEGWEPIGSSSNAFKAVFEGNGHVIRNLYINRPNTNYIGLFGYADNATIRRVGLTGTLTQITGRSEIGGILGYGIATHLQGVFASGALSSANTSTASMGGVAGYLTSNSTLEDSFSIASVTAKGTWVGGLVGWLENSTAKNVFSTGRVYSDLGSNIGGLIGYASSSPVTQSYWATDSSGQSSSAGTSSSNSSYFETTLAELGCATSPDDTNCVSGKTLFENWPTDAAANNGIAWVFDGNGLPALSLNGKQYRDRDGDGYLDQDDQWPDNYAAAIDFDKDGHPDRWTLGCDDECVTNSGLTLDMFPETAAAWQDDDLDGLPDSWAVGCDVGCQNASGLTLDTHLNDHHNGNPPDGIVIVDADHNGLIDIHTLDDLNAIRYNLEGTGLKLSANDENNSEGCPPRLVNGQMQRLCKGYELKADLDFDTNGDGEIDIKDGDYWNGGEGWLPIGSSSNAFKAVFEGNGHVIRNLYINRPNTSNLGLFGYADNATIRRVGLTGTLTQITGRSYVGGVLGYGKATHLQGVFVSGVLSSAYTSNAYMGGVAGYLELNSTIEDSVSTANVTAKSREVGGLVGNLYNSTVNRAFSTGRVYSDKTSYVGGLIGYESSSTVTQSYWATDSSGQSRSNGTSNSNPSYFGITLAELGCATSSNNTSCVSGKTLFENWPTNATANNGIAWVFDNTQLVPSLQINGVLHRDNDLDKDGIPNDQDAFPNNPAASVDSDGDGYPDSWNDGCGITCQQNSGLTLDAFPNNPAASVDSDGDGYPDSWNEGCDVTCQQNSGLTLDAFPNNPAASVDSDGDGHPDRWNDSCDINCQQNSGLTLDAYLNDFDNDGVPDLLDPDNNADNGAPEMQTVPSERHVSVDTTGVVGLLKYSDLLTELKAFDAVDGYDLTYQATANDALLEVQTIEDEQYLLVPVGRQVVQWTAKDNSGNQSESMEQIVNVYPQIGFVKSESITGENSSAGIEVYLSGVSPVYPLDVELEFDLDLEYSTLSQADVAAAINLSEIQTVQFLAGSTSAKLTINVLSDDEPEADETLLVRLIKAKTNSEENSYFTFNSDLKEHVLTVTERNLPPVVQLAMYQAGNMVSEVNWEQGDVTIEASIHDPNGNDSHTIAWDLSGLPHALVDEAKVSFSPDRLAGGDYSIAITVTDNGQPPLFAEAQLDIRINRPVVDEKPTSTPSKKKKRGSFPWPVLTVLVAAYAMRKLRHKGHAA